MTSGGLNSNKASPTFPREQKNIKERENAAGRSAKETRPCRGQKPKQRLSRAGQTWASGCNIRHRWSTLVKAIRGKIKTFIFCCGSKSPAALKDVQLLTWRFTLLAWTITHYFSMMVIKSSEVVFFVFSQEPPNYHANAIYSDPTPAVRWHWL